MQQYKFTKLTPVRSCSLLAELLQSHRNQLLWLQLQAASALLTTSPSQRPTVGCLLPKHATLINMQLHLPRYTHASQVLQAACCAAAISAHNWLP
jgi:hypothetical protein